jgi:predicted outer membrane repeat protein
MPESLSSKLASWCKPLSRRVLRKKKPELSIESLEDRTVPSAFTVTSLSDSGVGSLRDAIAQADATPGNSTINFAVSGQITLESALPDLSQNIDISGPGANVLTVARDPNAATLFRIFTIDSGDTVTLAGLTITGGNLGSSPFNSLFANGGGISSLGTLTVNNCVITNNGGWLGGGIFGHDLTVTNCVIDNNSAFDGGGIEADHLTLTNSIISNNSDTTGVSYGGGILVNQPGTFTNDTFLNNSSPLGGAVFDQGSTFTGCTFTGNTSLLPWQSALGRGGAIWEGSGGANIDNCTFSGNSASQGGGAIWSEKGTMPTISRSTFVGNQAINSVNSRTDGLHDGMGGAVGGFDGTIINCTFTGNSATNQGGAIWWEVASPNVATIANSTIVGNSIPSSGEGSGVYLQPPGGDSGTTAPGTVTFLNDIVAGNLIGSVIGDDVDIDSNPAGSYNTSLSAYNIIGDGDSFNLTNGVNGNQVGTRANPIDPLLGPLQDNGGPTQTMAPLPGSPALGAGSTVNAPATDQRGLPRVVNGLIDIGAYQTSVAPLTTGETLGTLRSDFSGWVGAQVTVGSSNLTVTQLGRMMVAGNTGTHTVKLVDTATGQDVASVDVSMAGGTPGQFQYATLSSPVTLLAGHTYYLVSQEVAGGDQWYDWDSSVTTTSAASVGPVWSSDGSTWNPFAPASGNEYGPVDLKYTVTL